jgi:hypothetical protein
MKQIKKIVELVIDFEGVDSEEFGVDVVSLVDKPAIQVGFQAFAAEELIDVTSESTEEEWMQVCMPVYVGEGYAQDQAAAICYSKWNNKELKAECDHDHLTETEMEAILQVAEGLGEEVNLNAVMIDFTKTEFSTLGDYLKGLAGLDVLTGDGHSVETKYQYSGPSAERNFCKAMLRMNKLYTIDEINQMSQSIDTGFRHQGQTYSLFDLKGGIYCKHYWNEVQVITNPDGGEVYINKGPARGDAGTPTDFMANRGAYGLQRVEFAVQDEEQRVVTGPALIPNKFILRKDAEGNPFYVYFTKETIKAIAERFFKKSNQNNTDVNHDHNVVDSNTLLESWIVDDPKFDKSSQYGFSLPSGSWMVSYRINDEETWQKIKAGELKGFSIAGDFIEKWYTD